MRSGGDGYRHFECKSVGGVSEAHRILSAQVARVQHSHDPRSTDLALIKDNYALDDARVPGYFCFSGNDFHRFQLAPVKARKFERYFEHKGGQFYPGPGDHKILKIGNERIHVNRKRDEIDLASLKAAAKTIGISPYKLAEESNAERKHPSSGRSRRARLYAALRDCSSKWGRLVRRAPYERPTLVPD